MKSSDRGPGTLAARSAPRALAVDLDAQAWDDEREREALARLLRRRRTDALLVYLTTRTSRAFLTLVEEWEALPIADYHVTNLGTEILRGHEHSRVWGWDRVLRQRWQRDSIAATLFRTRPDWKLQPEIRQSSYRFSVQVRDGAGDVARAFEEELRSQQLPCRVVFRPPDEIDLVPEGAGNAAALQWLIESLSIPLPNVVVVTRSAGAEEYVSRGFKVIVLSESPGSPAAGAPLAGAYVAPRPGAAGIGDGLRDLDLFRSSEAATSLIEQAFQKALEAVRKNVTPLGFSAASLADLKVAGMTAENYRSVWARDGMITMIWTLDLDEADIRDCGRRTLLTLLENQAPSGLVPTNVRIDTGRVEYSGLGEIASIDSGLWLLIGACRYVEKTGDLASLHPHQQRLQRTMDWLSAQDVNNCGLLEIPELGDWADLMGRSYNVLYDEVLWYSALNSYARLLTRFGSPEKAAEYSALAKKVKAKILDVFWPAGTAVLESARSFSQAQHMIGSASYLLAQITPFSFNWRCDVYGNLLAALEGILEGERAEKLFQFLWGVGVNEPWPVKCLYPPLDAGAPDWKSYLIVNMLNLPHHYHNGGIWPFIGGLWVRFLHRFGRVELAHRELRRLAELNKLGREKEWEFNEWAHGETGRPMGMAYQAWSAASYIKAYLELKRDPQLAASTEESSSL